MPIGIDRSARCRYPDLALAFAARLLDDGDFRHAQRMFPVIFIEKGTWPENSSWAWLPPSDDTITWGKGRRFRDHSGNHPD